MNARINHVAVIVAAIAYYAFQALWYAVFFGAQWREYTGKSQASFGPDAYIISFLMGLIVAYVVAIALRDSERPSMVRHGIEFGIFMGTGIWATNLLSLTLYEGRPLGLWAIDAFHVIIGIAIVGAIVGGWRTRA